MSGTEGDNEPEQERDQRSNPATDEARRIILARRSRFMAMALAGGLGVTAACGDSEDETGPEVCLSIAAGGPSQLPPDASGAGGSDAAGDAAPDSDVAE